MSAVATQPMTQRRRAEDGRLVSWKAIAAHLQVSVATVQRWEKQERLPVHRHMHLRQGTVFAYAWEVDAWLRRRDAAEALGSD